VLLGSAFARRNRTTDDYFRSGGRIPWWAAGLSIFATVLSSITYMSVPAQGYSVGWNLYLQNSYLILMPLVALVYLPFFRSLDVTTAYEYLERRFNAAVRLTSSAIFVLFQLGRVAIVLYLPALALSTVSSLDVTLSIVAMGGLCIVYTVFGGIEAVVWTDVVQVVVLVGGALWAFAIVLSRIDGGMGAYLSEAAAGARFFESVDWSLDVAIASGWVLVVGGIFTNLFSYTASQDIVQRYVTTRDERSARRAIWTNAAIAPLAQGLFFAIGTGLFVFYKQHPERLDPTLPNDGIFPLFIVRELPAGVAGAIVAAVFAAAQSTLSSSLNSVSTAIVTDFHRRIRPGASDRERLRLARWITAVVGLFATVAALVLAKSDIRSLWEAFLWVQNILGGTISGLFVLGIFSRRAHATGALIGAISSGALVAWISTGGLVHFFCFSLVGVATCVLVGWVASLIVPGPRVATEGLTVHSLRALRGRETRRSR
jgi:SSS family transporter